jgi:hypothetical protein
MALGDVNRENLPVGQSVPKIPRDPRDSFDPYEGRLSSNALTRALDVFTTGQVPKDLTDFNEWFPIALSYASANPNCSHEVIKRWTRVFKDINARAFSEGRKHIMAANMRNLVFEMKAYMSRGDNAFPGLSGIGTLVTMRQHVDQQVKMPQQPANPGLFGFTLRKKE